MRWGRATVALVMCIAGAAQAQDAVRGRRLFADTAAETGKDVAACISGHSDVSALRAMLTNRGATIDDAEALARWLQAVVDGAQPGAANAKAQFRGVLTARDVRDLAAYIVAAKAVASSAATTRLAGRAP